MKIEKIDVPIYIDCFNYCKNELENSHEHGSSICFLMRRWKELHTSTHIDNMFVQIVTWFYANYKSRRTTEPHRLFWFELSTTGRLKRLELVNDILETLKNLNTDG